MDNYRKIEIKGKGSYGQAMLVQHKQDRKFYIMKLIDASMYDLKQKEDAINEVNMLKDLYHPCIIRYRESFVDKNRYLCIVMDYADEGTLDQKINIYKQNNEYMNEQQVLEWFTQMCLAVKYIHDKRIIHRDLKTQNIFIKANEIKLGDFGIAKMLQTNGLCKTSIGTPYFISPEVCQKIPYDTQSDIWSLGCILYEMMALRHAFDAKTMEGLFIKIIRGQYPPVPNHFSEDLKNLLAQMLTVEPEKRIKIDEILQLDIIKRQAQIYFNKIKPQQSIPDLIEKMRMELENILGFQKFVEVYTKTRKMDKMHKLASLCMSKFNNQLNQSLKSFDFFLYILLFQYGRNYESIQSSQIKAEESSEMYLDEFIIKANSWSVPQKVQQKLNLLASLIDQTQSGNLDLLQQDEIQLLSNHTLAVQAQIFIDIVASFTIQEQFVEGVIELRGKSGFFWNNKQIKLDVDKKILFIKRKNNQDFAQVDLSVCSIKWVGMFEKKYCYQLLDSSKRIFGSDQEPLALDWFNYMKYCCAAYDDSLIPKSRISFTRVSIAKNQSKIQERQNNSIENNERKSQEDKLENRFQSSLQVRPNLNQNVQVLKSQSVAEIKIQEYEVEDVIINQPPPIIAQLIKDSQLDLDQLKDDTDYNLIYFKNKLRILQHKQNPTLLKAFMNLYTNNTDQFMFALSNPEEMIKWNTQIEQTCVLDMLNNNQSVIIQEIRKKYGLLYKKRYFQFIRYINESDEATIIVDKSIPYQDINSNFLTKGIINLTITALFQQRDTILLTVFSNTQNEGHINEQQNTLMNISYLQQLENLENYVIQKHYQILRPLFMEKIQAQTKPFRQSVLRSRSEFNVDQKSQFSIIDIQKSQLIQNHEQEYQSFKELLEIIVTRPHLITNWALHYYDTQPLQPNFKFYTKTENGLDIVLKDEWELLDKGGLKFINQRKINIQKEVLSFLLRKIGSTLLQGKSITNISLPVNIFEKRSNLERLCYGYTYMWLLEKAGELNDPVEQMKCIILFIFSASMMYLSMDKPFNPIIGETFQGIVNGNLVYAEQVSHHPPIASLQFYGKNFTLFGHLEQEAHFRANSIYGSNKGYLQANFKNGTKILFVNSAGCIDGINFGSRTYYLDGTMWCVDVQNELMAEVSINPFAGMFSGKKTPKDYVEGRIIKVTQKEIASFNKLGYEKYTGPKGAGQVLSEISGRFTIGINIDGKEVINWKKDFPYELQYVKNPLPSDSNYREDLVALKLDDLELAQERKEKLEVFQRKDRKLRQQRK